MVVVIMTLVFGIGAAGIDVSAAEFFGGFIPNVPTGSATIILSIVGTTAIPFNLFLAGSIADGNTVESMREGILLATCVAGTASLLIMIVGSGVDHTGPPKEFALADIAQVLRETAGETALTCFLAGLFCAAISATIGCAIAAPLAMKSLLSKVAAPKKDPETGEDIAVPFTDGDPWDEKTGLNFRGSLLTTIFVGSFAAAVNFPTVPVVLMAQLVNGSLLPYLATMLFLCINDPDLMEARPQTHALNVGLAFAANLTVFLCCVANIDKAWGMTEAIFEKDENVIFAMAGVITMGYFGWLARMLWKQKQKYLSRHSTIHAGGDYQSVGGAPVGPPISNPIRKFLVPVTKVPEEFNQAAEYHPAGGRVIVAKPRRFKQPKGAVYKEANKRRSSSRTQSLPMGSTPPEPSSQTNSTPPKKKTRPPLVNVTKKPSKATTTAGSTYGAAIVSTSGSLNSKEEDI